MSTATPFTNLRSRHSRTPPPVHVHRRSRAQRPKPSPRARLRQGVVPSGTLSFLFTDLADSTLLWEQREQEMADAVARHDSILTEEVERHGGRVVKSRGDGLMAVFADADAAVRAAVEGLRALRSEDWSVPLGVRMGVCTGPAREAGGDYQGQVVNRAARIADAAHPGQILVAPATAVFVEAFASTRSGRVPPEGPAADAAVAGARRGSRVELPAVGCHGGGARCGAFDGVRGPGERARRHRAAGVGASVRHADRRWRSAERRASPWRRHGRWPGNSSTVCGSSTWRWSPIQDGVVDAAERALGLVERPGIDDPIVQGGGAPAREGDAVPARQL